MSSSPSSSNFPVPNATQPPALLTHDLLSLFSASAQGDYIGESISQLEHSLQAAHFALQAAAPASTIVAALFHDIGQFLPLELLDDLTQTSVGRPNHASTGAAYLKGLGFPETVTSLVGEHVAAKKYLCATDSTYYAALSEASKASLRQQGGPMEEVERQEWERVTVGWEDCLRVRRWDDAAKVIGVKESTPRVEEYEGLVRGILLRARGSH